VILPIAEIEQLLAAYVFSANGASSIETWGNARCPRLAAASPSAGGPELMPRLGR